MFLSKKWWLGVVVMGLVLVSFAFSANNVLIKGNPASEGKKKSKEDSSVSKPSPHPNLSDELYQKALHGYKQLAVTPGLRKQLLTIVDFSKPSSEKRLFIIDMQTEKLLLHTYVAHGRNSGEKMADRFSNADASHQSSLGFYLTGGTYSGGNGYSLRLKGLEKGFNDNAERRAIVMHGAPYVSEEIIRSTGRLGRSWGCPAVSQKEHKQIIDLIKGGSCLFIYAPVSQYLTGSPMLKSNADSGMVL